MVDAMLRKFLISFRSYASATTRAYVRGLLSLLLEYSIFALIMALIPEWAWHRNNSLGEISLGLVVCGFELFVLFTVVFSLVIAPMRMDLAIGANPTPSRKRVLITVILFAAIASMITPGAIHDLREVLFIAVLSLIPSWLAVAYPIWPKCLLILKSRIFKLKNNVIL